MDAKSRAIMDIGQAIELFEAASNRLNFVSYPDSVAKRVALGFDTREEVKGNHGRSSMESFPTALGKEFDEIRARADQVRWDLDKFFLKVVK